MFCAFETARVSPDFPFQPANTGNKCIFPGTEFLFVGGGRGPFFAGAPVGASPSSTQIRVFTPQKAGPWVPPKGTQARSAKVHGLRGGGGALREWLGGGFGAAGPRGPRLHAGLPRHEDQRGDREGRGLSRGVRKGRVWKFDLFHALIHVPCLLFHRSEICFFLGLCLADMYHEDR